MSGRFVAMRTRYCAIFTPSQFRHALRGLSLQAGFDHTKPLLDGLFETAAFHVATLAI
jgi:hypothetical protein